MKRPQGFDQPVRRQPARPPASGPSNPPSNPRATPPPVSQPSNETEPIDVVVPDAPIEQDVAPVIPLLDLGSTDLAEKVSDEHASDRASARAIKRAQRARRRFEKSEVRRFTERGRRRRRAWVIGLGSVGALLVAVILVAYSPLMALRTVEVIGAERVPASDIEAALSTQIGTPLPLLDRGRVDEAMKGFPLLQSYSTESRPPGTLVVRVVERVPVGILRDGDTFQLVDAAGVVMQTAAEPPAGFPLIEVDGGASSAGFHAVTSVLRALPPEVLAQAVSASAATKDDVRLVLVGDTEVVWGSAENSTFKATVLASLMVSAPPDAVGGYDVSSPNSPVTF